MKKELLFSSFVLLTIFTQCNFQKIGRDTGKGFNENTETIAKNLLSGVNKGLSDPAFQSTLNKLVDSVISTAGNSANQSVKLVLDSLLSDRIIAYTARLVEEATGQKLKGNIAAITQDLQLSVGNLLGPGTRERVRLLAATAMNEILSDNLQQAVASIRESITGEPLRNNMAALRDSLLSDRTNAAVRAIVDTAMVTIAYRLKNDVNPSLQDNLSFIQRNATTLLIVLGAIALVIVIVIWRLKQKYAKMTTVLTSQIYAIPDQHAYDELTSRIKEKATISGVEPSLRKMLSENGLLGKESRESWQAKKAAVLQSRN
ncbi:MAG TPA: hypothetical protein VGN63_07565 [Flavisolibacter sp.]|jgi:hypothetical protein|nr:hypothetical protein [Flavisolibacter sp.]